MVKYIHIMVHCPCIGCPRSIRYCFGCEYKRAIVDYDLICDFKEKNIEENKE